jgi:DNA/RNA-binding domain of Phe-tRNA-synthetase-like protein
MKFRHDRAIWDAYPELGAGVIHVEGIDASADPEARVAHWNDVAASRLAGSTESELPEIQAWRRTFSRMGLKPTQYRCASESLLRRFRKEGVLPRLHPLVDLCNALSLAWAIPIAVIDLDHVEGDLTVRLATGDETYVTFGGGAEHPEPGEVVFADDAGFAHARRWTNRQSGRSAVRQSTTRALIVTEAMHADAAGDVQRLVETLKDEMTATWPVHPTAAILTADRPVFTI